MESTAMEFVIQDDYGAEKLLREIAEEKAEAQRLMNVCNTMILEYQHKIKQIEDKLSKSIEFKERLLRGYFEFLPDKKVTKTQVSYKLPSGTLKLKQQQPEIVRNEEELLPWVEQNSPDYVKVEKTVKWGDLKKILTITDDRAISENGEIIPGVVIKPREAKFVVEVE